MHKIIKNKRAILASETLKLLIALLCISLLIYLGVRIYNFFTQKSKLEQAKGTLDEIMQRLNNLPDGGSKDYLIESPQGWAILSYRDEKKICICPKDSDENGQKEKCKNGICKEITFSLEIESVCFFNIYNCFALEELPKKIILERKGENYELKTESEVLTEKIIERIVKSEDTKKAIVELAADKFNENKKENLRESIEILLKENEKTDWILEINKNSEKPATLTSREPGLNCDFQLPSSIEQEGSFKIESDEYKIILETGIFTRRCA